jgi:endonuclease/exonuclease/phosphatase family metal-dependent hydrolase
MQFRIITYNIHKGIGGVDRRYRPERIITTLHRYDADIIFLQEVDNDVPRSRFHRQVDLIGDALKMRYRAFQCNVKLTRGHYGNAILSRYPLSDIENINLTISIKKRRRALVAHCKLMDKHQQTLLLINCHLGLAGFERVMQLRKILDSSVMKYVHHDTPVIIGGDYNDVWGTLGKNVMIPATFKAVSKKINTFPAIMPVRQLDHVYYRGDLDCLHSFPGHSNLARQASDHLPLIADFELSI